MTVCVVYLYFDVPVMKARKSFFKLYHIRPFILQGRQFVKCSEISIMSLIYFEG